MQLFRAAALLVVGVSLGSGAFGGCTPRFKRSSPRGSGDFSSVALTYSPVASLVFVTQPTSTNRNVPIAPIQIRALDPLLQPVVGAPVHLSLTPTDRLNVPLLSGTLTRVTNQSGIAEFDLLSLDRFGEGLTLTARASPGGLATSNPFEVTPCIETPGAMPFSAGAGALTDPYILCTKEELDRIATGGAELLSKHYKLMANIDMGGPGPGGASNFAMIGSDTTPFTGSFDGSGKTIHRMHLSPSGLQYVGFFRAVGDVSNTDSFSFSKDIAASQFIRNLHFTSASIDNAYYNVGIVAGGISHYVLESISVQGTITVAASPPASPASASFGGISGRIDYSRGKDLSSNIHISGLQILGGIAGDLRNSRFENLSAQGTIVSTGYTDGSTLSIAGGLAGNLSGVFLSEAQSSVNITASGAYSGGLAGRGSTSMISDSVATGGIVSTHDFVGGVFGESAYVALERTVSTGAIQGRDHVGGLIGAVGTAGTFSGGPRFYASGVIHLCSATGALSGSTNVGGLVGSAARIHISHSFASGAVAASTSGAGGLIGQMSTASATSIAPEIVDSYWNSETTTQGSSAGPVGGQGTPLTSAQMGNAASYPNWDFATGWTMTLASGGGFSHPTLRVLTPCSTSSFAGGTGTLGDPYLISSVQQLKNMTSTASDCYKKSFRLTQSLNLGHDESFRSPGQSRFTFIGSLDGGSHEIQNFANTRGHTFTAFFPFTDRYSSVSHLGLTGVSLLGSELVGALSAYFQGSVTDVRSSGSVRSSASRVGGLLGAAYLASVSGASSSANVELTSSIYAEAGGLISFASASTVTHSSASGTVTSPGQHTGGLIGRAASVRVQTSSASGSVTYLKPDATTQGSNRGGLIGSFTGTGFIEDSAYIGPLVEGTSTSIGGLVGLGQNASRISRSYSLGTVTASSGIGGVGGLVGQISLSFIVEHSYSGATVNGSTSSSAGGLVGVAASTSTDLNTTIRHSYSYGAVQSGARRGGILGQMSHLSTRLENSFTFSPVSGSGSSNYGGLIGSLALGGGANLPSPTGCYWDTEATGQALSVGSGAGLAEGKTTAEMKVSPTYSGWSFAPTPGYLWSLPAGGYPRLWWQP
jgi:hypothetical protein